MTSQWLTSRKLIFVLSADAQVSGIDDVQDAVTRLLRLQYRSRVTSIIGLQKAQSDSGNQSEADQAAQQPNEVYTSLALYFSAELAGQKTNPHAAGV